MRNRAQTQQTKATNGIGSRLRRAISFAGLSIRDFSERTSIPYRTLHDYLAGNRKPGADHLIRMAGAGVDVTWLLTGRSRPALSKLRFPADTTTDDIIGSDARLLERLYTEAMSYADDYAKRYFERNKTILSTSQTMIVVSYYYGYLLRLAAAVASTIEELRRCGTTEQRILDMLAPGVSPDLDPKLDQLVAEVPKQGYQSGDQ